MASSFYIKGTQGNKRKYQIIQSMKAKWSHMQMDLFLLLYVL